MTVSVRVAPARGATLRRGEGAGECLQYRPASLYSKAAAQASQEPLAGMRAERIEAAHINHDRVEAAVWVISATRSALAPSSTAEVTKPERNECPAKRGDRSRPARRAS